jgi:hypothetical protein
LQVAEALFDLKRPVHVLRELAFSFASVYIDPGKHA